mmetsp:Transcript_17289/g.32789  ORF Transcript_17289/g.32789 Transcript_17289/m.32789 type:complete len:200 (+) Transcript_17289:400-999(+)
MICLLQKKKNPNLKKKQCHTHHPVHLQAPLLWLRVNMHQTKSRTMTINPKAAWTRNVSLDLKTPLAYTHRLEASYLQIWKKASQKIGTAHHSMYYPSLQRAHPYTRAFRAARAVLTRRRELMTRDDTGRVIALRVDGVWPVVVVVTEEGWVVASDRVPELPFRTLESPKIFTQVRGGDGVPGTTMLPSGQELASQVPQC